MVKENVYELKKFSHFLELVKALKSKEMVVEIKKAPALPETLVKAIKEDKFPTAQDLRKVSKVLKVKTARRSFLEGGVDIIEAFDEAKVKKPEYDDSLFNNIKKLTHSLRECSVEKIEEIKKDGNKAAEIKTLFRTVRQLCKKIGISVSE